MKEEDVTPQIVLEALDKLYKQNEYKGDDIQNAIKERQTAIRRQLAHQALDDMLVDFLGLDFTPIEADAPSPTVEVQGELPYEGTHND